MKIRWFDILSRFGVLIVFAGLFLLFATLNPVFLHGTNLINILENSAILMILALGMTLIVAVGEIDLSIGIALDFGAAFAIVAMKSYAIGCYGALCIGVIAGALIGSFNAILVAGLGISSFLATLSTFFIGSSVERIFTHGGGPISYRHMPEAFRNLALGEVFGMPVETIVAFALVVAYFLLLECSILGQRIHAMGMQRQASVVAGIRIKRMLILSFLTASSSSAIAGMIAAAQMRMFTPLSGFSYTLDAIAAVFIGAALNRRGRPFIPGTVVAVLFLGMVENGLNLMGLDFNTKDALEGIILVSALALAMTQRRMRNA